MQHSFDTEVAEQYGIEAAIIIQNIQYWLTQKKANEESYHDGHHWIYNSLSAWRKLFPYMTERSIRTALETLQKEGVLIVGCYNKNTFDRTRWFAFADEEKWLGGGKNRYVKTTNALDDTSNGLVKTSNASDQNDTTIPIVNSISKPLVNNLFISVSGKKIFSSEELIETLERYKAALLGRQRENNLPAWETFTAPFMAENNEIDFASEQHLFNSLSKYMISKKAKRQVRRGPTPDEIQQWVDAPME